MARNSFDININLKGFGKAHRELDKTQEGMDRMRTATSGLRRQVGALRNNMLLVSFAIGGAAVTINKFIQAASGFEDVRTRLIGLTGSVEEGNKAFERFNAIASTTPFALQDVVNAGAQLEAFGLNSKATLSSVTDLAAFMQTTATEAANALGRAFAGGVGAADLLRDRGIRQIIQDSQGIEDITKITLPEFRSALISALTDPNGRISGSAERMSQTWTGAVSNMNDALVTLAASVGEVFLPFLKEAVKGVEDFARSLNKKDAYEFATALTVVTGGFIFYKRSVIAAALANLKFGKSLKRTAWGVFLIGATSVVNKLLEFVGVFDSLDVELANHAKELERAKQEEAEYQRQLELNILSVNGLSEAEEERNRVIERGKKRRKSRDKSMVDRLLALQSEELAIMKVIDPTLKITAAMIEEAKILGVLTPNQKLLVEEIAKQEEVNLKLNESIKEKLKLEEDEKKNQIFLTDRYKDRIKIANETEISINKASRLTSAALLDTKLATDENYEAELRRQTIIEKMSSSLKLNVTDQELLLQTLGNVTSELKRNEDGTLTLLDGMTNYEDGILQAVEQLVLEESQLVKLNEVLAENKRIREEMEAEEEAHQRRMEMNQEIISAVNQTTSIWSQNMKARQDVELSALKSTEAYRDASTEERQNLEKDALRQFQDEASTKFRIEQASAMAGIAMNTAEAVSKSAILLPATLGSPLKEMHIALGLAQAAMVASQKPPAFALGGDFITQGPQAIMVGDNPGGRERVQVTPLSSPNINGPQGGNVTVNVSAPLVDDTVIDSLIPAIQSALNEDRASLNI